MSTELPNDSSNVTLLFPCENHTLGNILRDRLLKDPEVIFAGYKVPHPLTPSVEVRVQTLGAPAVDTVNTALKSLVKDVDAFEQAFNKATK